MRLGLIVDGESEFKALPRLYESFVAETGNVILRPVLAKVSPKAPFPVIARGCTPAVRQLEGRPVTHVLVVLDREDRRECAPEIAGELRVAIGSTAQVPIDIVVKNRQFENWLVASCDALASQAARFEISDADRARVNPDRADSVDGLALLKRCCKKSSYNKVLDSDRILARANPLRIAANSRSFRRLLRSLEHPRYCSQSRRP